MNIVQPLRLFVLLCTPALGSQTQLDTVVVASGFVTPIDLAQPGDDTSRLLVAELSGRIRVVRNGAILPTPFLDVRPLVETRAAEQGLLGMAFHPDYARNGLFFISYTRAGDGASILARYSVSATNPDVADPNSAVTMFGPVTQFDGFHNGGCIRFGPDGYLYLGLGDGRGFGDLLCVSQRLDYHLGKMLRLDVDGPTAIAPPSNPYVGTANALDEIWSIGFRNPWRFSFDRETGDLFIGDVGQSSREEIDFQPASSSGKENYGWKIQEGSLCFSTSGCDPTMPSCGHPGLTNPLHELPRAEACAIIGGYVYRGCAIPSLRGKYVFGDFCRSTIWSLEQQAGQLVTVRDRTSELGALRVRAFGEDAAGELYIMEASNLRRLVANAPSPAVDLGFGKIGGSGVEPVFSVCGLLTVGESAEFSLRDAPPMTAAALLLGTVNQPTLIPPFGTVVPIPNLFSIPRSTDGNGEVKLRIPGGAGLPTFYGQWLMFDAGASGGIGISNALQINF